MPRMSLRDVLGAWVGRDWHDAHRGYSCCFADAWRMSQCCSAGDFGAIGGSEMAKLGPPKQSEDVMGGGQYIEPWLSAAVKDASGQPLGSMQNPVRAEMPRGQHAYLQRLRCANGQAPQFSRVGDVGFGVFGSIVDAYEVTCAGSSRRGRRSSWTCISPDMWKPGRWPASPSWRPNHLAVALTCRMRGRRA